MKKTNTENKCGSLKGTLLWLQDSILQLFLIKKTLILEISRWDKKGN